MDSFEKQLSGGHPNSLGNTVKVVQTVLKHPNRFEELFQCYFSEDAVVRLRVSNAMKRIGKERPDLLVPYLDRFLDDIARIEQASTQWTLAQLFLLLENAMGPGQLLKAKKILTHNLEHHQDWIVLNMTMETLAHWSKVDDNLRNWLIPHLDRLVTDSRKSISKKAQKLLHQVA